MAATSGERREVARKLRDCIFYAKGHDINGDCDMWSDKCVETRCTLYNDIAACIEECGNVNLSAEEVFTRLADLIESEEEDTCCDVSDDENVFTCSRCGCSVKLWAAEADVFENVTYGPTLTMPNGRGGELSFCPNCGARVVSGNGE